MTPEPPSRRAALSLLCAFTAAACAPGDPVSDTTERTTVGDTLVVFSTAPRYADTIRAREVARFGAFSGDPELLFSTIFAFAPTSDGGMIVHDEGEGIRRYDREGNFADRVARTGEGPGEVTYLPALIERNDGLVAAYDLGNQRISIYEPEGARSVPRPEGMPRYGGDAVFFDDEGSLWIGVGPPFPRDGVLPHPRPIFARLGEDGALVDTVYTPERLTADCPELSTGAHRRGFWEDVREPFLPKVKWTPARDGSLLVGCPATYQFELLRPDGSVVRFSRAWDAVELADDHRTLLAEQLRITGLPPERPAYARLVAWDSRRAWVRPTLPSVPFALPPEVVEQVGVTHTFDESTRAVLDVFTFEDGWLGTVALPSEARFSGYPTTRGVVIRGDSVWAVAADSLDVEYVVKYVVEWPEG